MERLRTYFFRAKRHTLFPVNLEIRQRIFFNRVAEDFGTRAWATGRVAERQAIRRWTAERIIYGENILDVGVGNGLMFQYLKRKINYTGIDISENMLIQAGIRARHYGIPFTALQGNAAALPFPDSSFDTVMCIDMFHHIPRFLRSRVLGELVRVVRPRGQIIIEIKNQWNPFIACGYLIGGMVHGVTMVPVNPFNVRHYFSETGFHIQDKFIVPPRICPPFIVFDLRQGTGDVRVIQ